MSCGRPHAHDCSEVLERIYVFIDGEATSADCAWIQEHLDECGPCLQQYGMDVKVKTLVARSCGCDPVPDDVRERMIGRITSLRASQVVQSESGFSTRSLDITRVEFESE